MASAMRRSARRSGFCCLRRLGLDHRAGLRRAGAAAQVLERVQHGVEHVPRQVDARPALLAPLHQQAARLELPHRAARRRVGHLEDALGLRHGHGRRAEELVGEAQRVALDLLAVALVVTDERARLAGRALGRLVDADGEEREPRRPLVVRAHALQQRVVLVAMALEERREIEQRPREALALDEEQRDEQPPQAAVAADERVDGLELRVEHRALDEVGQACRAPAGTPRTPPAPPGAARPAPARRSPSPWWRRAGRASSARCGTRPACARRRPRRAAGARAAP